MPAGVADDKKRHRRPNPIGVIRASDFDYSVGKSSHLFSARGPTPMRVLLRSMADSKTYCARRWASITQYGPPACAARYRLAAPAQTTMRPTANAQWSRRDGMRLACLLCMLSLLPAQVFAHGGGLDASGCHTNRKTGAYHCHRSRAPANSLPVPQPYRFDRRSPSDLGACGAKYYCTQMSSCEEAVHYLFNCGLTRLDGDGDGIPCESLCGNR